MKPGLFKHLLAALGMAALLLSTPMVCAEEAAEYDLKALFLYNIALFTEWPDGTLNGSLPVCVLGNAPFGAALPALEKKSVGVRQLVVTRQPDRADLKKCRVLFISASEQGTLTELLATLQGSPVLTVMESAGSAQQGAMVNLSLDGKKLIFEVNLAAVQQAGLSISSKALRLAKKVY